MLQRLCRGEPGAIDADPPTQPMLTSAAPKSDGNVAENVHDVAAPKPASMLTFKTSYVGAAAAVTESYVILTVKTGLELAASAGIAMGAPSCVVDEELQDDAENCTSPILSW